MQQRMQQMSFQTIKTGNVDQRSSVEDGLGVEQKQDQHLEQVNEQDDEQDQTHDSSKTPCLDGLSVTTRFLAAVAFIAASFFRYPRETLNYEISAFIFIGAMSLFVLSNCLEMISASNFGKCVAGHIMCASAGSIIIAANIIYIVKLSLCDDGCDGEPLIDVDASLWITGSTFLVIGHLVETITVARDYDNYVLASVQAPVLGILGSLFFVFGSVLALEQLLYPDTDYYYGLIEGYEKDLEETMTVQSALYFTGSSVYVLHAIVYTIAKYSRV
eukprot:scaffold1262_cov206-Chaetoceros_neogracile.AAC.3